MLKLWISSESWRSPLGRFQAAALIVVPQGTPSLVHGDWPHTQPGLHVAAVSLGAHWVFHTSLITAHIELRIFEICVSFLWAEDEGSHFYDSYVLTVLYAVICMSHLVTYTNLQHMKYDVILWSEKEANLTNRMRQGFSSKCTEVSFW